MPKKSIDITRPPRAKHFAEERGTPGTPKKFVNFGVLENDSVDVMLYGVIGWEVDADDFVSQLKGVTAKTINLSINSVGGDVFDGTAIYNALKTHPAKKIVSIDGIAASAASLIAMAGDTINIAKNAYLMIHRATSFAFGNGDDMRATADVMDKIDKAIAGTYVDRTGKPLADINTMLAAETWFVGQEAVDAGFCDSVTNAAEDEPDGDETEIPEDRVTAAMAENLKMFSHVPKRVAAMINRTTRPPAPATEQSLLTGLAAVAFKSAGEHWDRAPEIRSLWPDRNAYKNFYASVFSDPDPAEISAESANMPLDENRIASIKARAAQEFNANSALQDGFESADVYARVKVREAKEAADAPRPMQKVPTMAALIKRFEAEWDKNLENCHDTFEGREMYIKSNVSQQRIDDKRDRVFRHES